MKFLSMQTIPLKPTPNQIAEIDANLSVVVHSKDIET